jgi:hypothetical protein
VSTNPAAIIWLICAMLSEQTDERAEGHRCVGPESLSHGPMNLVPGDNRF